MMPDTIALTDAQIAELERVKAWKPFCRVFGATNGTDFRILAKYDNRAAKRLVAKGYCVYELTKGER